MSERLIQDLKSVIAKHEEDASPEIIRWIPICDEYKGATSARVSKERGGKTLICGNKTRYEVDVLVWLKVRINPASYPVVQILETVRP